MGRSEQTAVFPIRAGNNTAFDQRGLAKRELFAAMAMQGVLSAHQGWPQDRDASEVARRSVVAADALLAALAAPVSTPNVDAMVNRFLGWKLPADFYPDCYVSFDREKAKANNGWPIGTNLLTAAQAKAMFQHCLASGPSGVDDNG